MIVALLFAILITVFAVQNATAVDIRCLFWKIDQAPLSLVILTSVAAGAIIVFVIGAFHQFKMSLQIRDLTARLQRLKPKASPEENAPAAGEKTSSEDGK